MFGRLVCGLVLVMTAVPGPPELPLPPFRLRSSSAIRGAPCEAPAAALSGEFLFTVGLMDIAEASRMPEVVRAR
jgi:hypothetical protein